MSLYKPGDKVIVRPDLTNTWLYETDNKMRHVGVVSSMASFAGGIVTIKYAATGSNDGCYKIEEDGGNWWWCDGMFVPVETKEISVDESDWGDFFSGYQHGK